MNKRIVLGTILIMGAGFLYNQSAHSMEKSNDSLSSTADTITLISSDKISFTISRETAKQSLILKDILENDLFEEARSGKFRFSHMPGELLEKMVALLEALKNKNDAESLVIEQFIKPDGSSDMNLLIDLATAANYLQIQNLSNALINLYMFQRTKYEIL